MVKAFLAQPALLRRALPAFHCLSLLCDNLYYWSPAGAIKTKADFLLQRGRKEFIAIEVKLKDQIFPDDLKGLKAIAPLAKKRIVVFLGDRKRKTKEGIDIWPFAHFCKALEKGRL